MDYYIAKHGALLQQKLGPALKGVAVEQGLGGAAPGSPATYIAMGHLYFDSVEAFQASFGPHAESIMGDIPNFSDIQPRVQISEVKL